MRLFKWPEKYLRQKFCKTTFKGLKTNPKPVKEESQRRTGGQLTERLSCCLQIYRFWTNGWQPRSRFLFEGQTTLNILKNTLLCCNEFESAQFTSEDHRKIKEVWILVTDFREDTTHTSVYLRKGTRDRPKQWLQQVNLVNQWLLILLLMNVGEGLLCKQKRWLKSSCIPGNPPISQGDDLDLWSSLHSLQRLNSRRVSLWDSDLMRVSPQPLLPPFDNAGEGLQRISQVSVPLKRWPLLSLLSLSHVRCGGEKRPWLMQHG